MTGSYSNLPGERSGGDPNIMKLQESNKVRPLDNVVAGWIQHGIEHPSDAEKFASVVCPGPRTCPLCRKPVNAKGEQHFPRSKRYAANVWDYASNSPKVLIAGPMVFDEFKKAAGLSISPDSCDWTIVKTGSGKSTNYEVIRHDTGPAAFAVTPDQLHDVGKYEQPTSAEAIFEILETFGIDYDALTVPSYTYEQALAYTIPFGKHKGLTVEQLVSGELEYGQWLHGSRLEQGQLGDPTFLALQTVMEERGLVPPLDDALSMLPEPEVAVTAGTPNASAGAATQAPAPAQEEKRNPEQPYDLPDTPPEGMVRLKSPIGVVTDIPDAAVGSMLTLGFTRVELAPEPEPEAPAGTMSVIVGGQQVDLPAEQARMLIEAGTAQAVGGPEPEPEPEPAALLPLPDEIVQVNVAGTEVPMPYVQAAQVVDNAASNAKFSDPALQTAHEAANERGAQAAAASPTTTQSPETTSTGRQHDPEKPYECDQCDWAGKTKGALTQHKTREHKAATPEPSAVPAASNGGGVAERLKAKIATAPFARDYQRLMAIMEEETGTSNFSQMDEAGLEKLEKRIDAELAAAK